MNRKINLPLVSHGQGHLVHQLLDDLKSTIVTGSFHVTLTRCISALRRSSAYILFKRQFSSSNSFMRLMSEVSMPPNFARYL